MIWRLILAALLGAAINGCGGEDSPSPDPTSGSGGISGVGGSDDNNEVRASLVDDEWVCPSGMALREADMAKADETNPPHCDPMDQPDPGGSSGTGGSGGSPLPDPPDAAPPADECPDLDGKLCDAPNMSLCTWHVVEGSSCSFQCTVPDGRMPYSIEEGEGSIDAAWAVVEACNITL